MSENPSPHAVIIVENFAHIQKAEAWSYLQGRRRLVYVRLTMMDGRTSTVQLSVPR